MHLAAANLELSVKTLAEELETSTDVLSQVSFSTGVYTTVDIGRLGVVTTVRSLEEHSAALSQFISSVSAVMKFGASAIKDHFIELQQEISSKSNCDDIHLATYFSKLRDSFFEDERLVQ